MRWYGMVMLIRCWLEWNTIMSEDLDVTLGHRNWFEVGRWTISMEKLFSIAQFPFFLSLLILLYSKTMHNFRRIPSALVMVHDMYFQYELWYPISHYCFQYCLDSTLPNQLQSAPTHDTCYWMCLDPSTECKYCSELVLFLFGSIYYLINAEHIFLTNVSTTNCSTRHWISSRNHINHRIPSTTGVILLSSEPVRLTLPDPLFDIWIWTSECFWEHQYSSSGIQRTTQCCILGTINYSQYSKDVLDWGRQQIQGPWHQQPMYRAIFQ